MHYVMLIFHGATPPLPGTPAWEALSSDEQKAVYAEYAALNSIPGVTPGVPMGLPGDATTVRVEEGRMVTTDGPFAETREAVGGYFLVEADDLDAALAIAAKVPATRFGGAVEVRPVQTYW